MNTHIEDILFESYKLGLKDVLFKEWNQVKEKYPNMEVAITLDIAWEKVLNEYKTKDETGKTDITSLPS
jgi:hypothetical protein